MPEADADRQLLDRDIASVWILELREICKESANQRARAKRQRGSALAMREEAREIRERTCRDWPRMP